MLRAVQHAEKVSEHVVLWILYAQVYCVERIPDVRRHADSEQMDENTPVSEAQEIELGQ